MIRRSILAFALICFFNTSFAQTYKQITHRIDSFGKVLLPKSALTEVDKLDDKAHREKNASMQIRAAIYRMAFQSVIEENAIVPIIIRLKQDIGQAGYPVKPVLQSLLADMYWQYYRQNRWQFMQRTRIEQHGDDFTKWDLQTINSEISRNFDLSLQAWQQEQNTPIDELNDVLYVNKSTRYLRPTLYDLLVQQAFDFFLSEEAGVTRPKNPFVLTDPKLFGDSRTFSELTIATSDTASVFYKGLKYLQQATLFHLRNPAEEALADIDMKRLGFLQVHVSIINKDSLYLQGLRNIEKVYSAKAISADAWVLEGKYFQDKNDLKSAYAYYQKAATIYPESIGGRNGALKIKEILHKQLSGIVENVNMPDKPILALMDYRNVKTTHVIVYKVSATQYTQLAKIPSDISRYADGTTIYASDSVFKYLSKLKPIQDKKLSLPETDDYIRHTTEFKIDPLKSGHYVLILRDDQSDDKGLVGLTGFKVCKLAYAARRKGANQIEVQVTNRETGQPVSGVQVTLAETQTVVSNADGKSYFNNAPDQLNSCSVKLTSTTDTLYTPSNYLYNFTQTNRKPTNTILFTDRVLYRPGQTIYFKGLHLQTTDGKSTIVTGEKMTVDIKDNNNKSLITIPVTTSDFGTFNGTYTLPQNLLNGNVTINTGDGSTYVRVEEYKRPGFQVTVLPVEGSYKPNDSVTVKGKVTAYSGYGLSQAKVAYHITRLASLTDYRLYQQYSGFLMSNNEFVVDTIETDNQGAFEIKFKASTDPGADLSKLNYQFQVTMDVTDGSGETRSANTWVKVGINNINVIAAIPERVFVRDSIRLMSYIANLNGISQKGDLQVKVYALQSPGQLFKARLWGKPDKYAMSREQYKKDFSDYAYQGEDDHANWGMKNKVAELSMATNKKQVFFNLDMLKKQPTGTYKIVVNAKNERGDTTSAVRYVYLVNEPGRPDVLNDWEIPVTTTTDPGTPAEFLLGTGKAGNVLMEKYEGTKMISSEWLKIPAGKQQLVKVPVSEGQKSLSVQFLMICENRMYSMQHLIVNKKENAGLDVRFMTFRDILQPGEKEQWKLRVSAKNNEKLAAEMVASLYDTSLDDLGRRDHWNTNVNAYHYPNYNWGYTFVDEAQTNPLKYNGETSSWVPRQYEKLNMFGYNYYGGYNFAYRSYYAKAKSERVMGDTMNYDAIGYGVLKKTDLTGSVSSLNEVAIAEPVGNSAIALSGRVSGVKLNGEDFSPIRIRGASSLPADVIENIQVVDDYGDQANLAGRPIATRKNFAETAFFYPELHTDENGEILIDFTIPESLTKWRFRAFAHTKGLKTGYIEKEIITQKQLSINANMPRFLREGDTITVSARLANLVATDLKGKVKMQLFNGITMQPVQLLFNVADAQQSFEIKSATTKTVSFKLVVPAGLDALTYKLTADAGQFTDGEENTLPVLPNRMLVTESMPMMVRPGQSRSYTFEKLTKQTSTTLKNKTVTLEYTQNPTWYAVQALPYMMEFPYECSEQIFSRYYANSLGNSLVNKMPVVKQIFDQWKAGNSPELLSNLEKNQELKATLIEETPWLRDAQNETEQKKRIALLFDMNKMSYELKQNLDKLQKRQLPDGGFPWFGGDRSDRYITIHILEGIGQLYHLNIANLKDQELKDIADKAMQYLNNVLADDANWEKKHDQYEGRIVSPIEIFSYYIQSYYPGRAVTAEQQALQADYLQHAGKEWIYKGIYEQGLIALTMLRNGKPEVAKAIIRSLMETAQQSEEMGMYWAKNRLGWYWYQSPVETQSLLIELFTEAGDHDKAVAEMKIWLLRNKQTNNWKTTKATAAACYALLLKGDDWLADQSTSEIKLGGNELSSLKPDVKADAGTGYIKTTWTDEQIKPSLGKVDIKNNGKTISWGAVHWQYLENLDKITPSTTDITLERKYFILKRTGSGEMLTAVDAAHQPKTGDLLKVVVYLKAGRDYEYVQLKDMRPAGTEPVDVLSSYKYQDGLYYYQVTKDVATNFFISNLNKGNYVFEYRLRVAQPGNFSTGITSVQSMYAPEFNAHSEGMRMGVK
ncbi:alpha-2-macroglobulin [Mucilaginibacter sp. AW1-3]